MSRDGNSGALYGPFVVYLGAALHRTRFSSVFLSAMHSLIAPIGFDLLFPGGQYGGPGLNDGRCCL